LRTKAFSIGGKHAGPPVATTGKVSRGARLEESLMSRISPFAAIAVAGFLSLGPAAAAPPGQTGAVNFRFGGFFPSGHSDFWDYQETYYTLDHSDFNTLNGGVGYTGSINNYVEFDVNADFYAASTRSSDREIVDSNSFPIFHDSRLAVFPLTVGIRVLPAGRYARRGAEGQHFVRHPVPYIGAGIGMEYWWYEEEGDFAFADSTVPEGLSIFYDRRRDTGVAFETHAMLGLELPVSPEWNISFEVRQSWAEASLSNTFPSTALGPGSPNRLDLGGTSVFFGAAVRF
jgi:hypothetical protein